MSEQNRPADETGLGADRAAGSGWAPQQSRPASTHQTPGSGQPASAPTEQFPTAGATEQPSATPPFAAAPATAHQPWPPAGYGTAGYQRTLGASAPAGAVPPAGAEARLVGRAVLLTHGKSLLTAGPPRREDTTVRPRTGSRLVVSCE
ncbi:hypothetical protein [Modestobacter sp. KNN46-3]|uniref:hypothetical protein n=1 Tax=Modestobacter sp. KNN46-3 TaxID=2711218 RepID=UPI0013DFFC70|nr:hypothetical protein [Modestobacter sp. KNN46-3]